MLLRAYRQKRRKLTSAGSRALCTELDARRLAVKTRAADAPASVLRVRLSAFWRQLKGFTSCRHIAHCMESDDFRLGNHSDSELELSANDAMKEGNWAPKHGSEGVISHWK
jgi:hypothetical protein